MKEFTNCEIELLADLVASRIRKVQCCPPSSKFTLNTENTSSVTLEGNGTASDPLTAVVNISQDVGNSLEIRDDGLYVTGSSEEDDTHFKQLGNAFGEAGVLGTTDNFDLIIITNNVERSRFTNGGLFQHSGNVYLNQALKPSISFFTNSLAASDYYIQRDGTTLAFQSAGIVDLQIGQRSGHTLNANVLRGHEFYSMQLVNEVIAQLLPSGEFSLKKYGINTFAGIPEYGLGVTSVGDVVEYNPVTEEELIAFAIAL